MKIQHYVKNLKRKPLRLAAWLGGNRSLGLPLSETTVCYSVDGSQFSSFQEICRFAERHGFDWSSVADRETIHEWVHEEEIHKNEGALRLSIDILLRHIASQPDGWYVIWHDDVVLDRKHADFCKFLETIADPTVEIILGFVVDPYHIEDKLDDTDYQEAFFSRVYWWEHKEENTHTDLPLYESCIGLENDGCIIVTPQGAAKLLAFGETLKGAAYEFLLFWYLHEAELRPYVWTIQEQYTEYIGHTIGGDIWPLPDDLMPAGWTHFWRAAENGEVWDLSRMPIKPLLECKGTWDLMQPQNS